MRWWWILIFMGCGTADPLTFTAVSFNTGTTDGLAHDAPPDDGYDSTDAATSDMYYGNGLAWVVAVEATTRFFEDAAPDIVGFQEIFYSRDCDQIPAEARPGFVCESYATGDPTVANIVLGAGYQVACHVGKPDKCIGIKKSFGSIEGCANDLCLDGLEGEGVDGCGRGARVARASVELADGRLIGVVNVHGSSGISPEDTDCRTKQFEQALALVRGERTVMVGDLNTDPARLFDGDVSAAKFFRGARAAGLDFVSDVGDDVPPTYAGLFNIDHVLTDFADGSCETKTVLDAVYFDHRPIACTMTERAD